MKQVIEEVIEATPGAIERGTSQLPSEFTEPLTQSITGGILDAAKRLKTQWRELC
jgi:hypothetical protein